MFLETKNEKEREVKKKKENVEALALERGK
jgi:hypothetical protein